VYLEVPEALEEVGHQDNQDNLVKLANPANQLVLQDDMTKLLMCIKISELFSRVANIARMIYEKFVLLF
jgi:hypothetical protein